MALGCIETLDDLLSAVEALQTDTETRAQGDGAEEDEYLEYLKLFRSAIDAAKKELTRISNEPITNLAPLQHLMRYLRQRIDDSNRVVVQAEKGLDGSRVKKLCVIAYEQVAARYHSYLDIACN